ALDRPWLVRAALTPGARGHRIVDIETQKLPARDLMLAMRLGDGQYEADMPMSARIRADFGPDGIPQSLEGRIVLEQGTINDPDPLILNRLQLHLRIDPDKQRIAVEQGELGNAEVGVAISGGLDFGGSEPRLALGVAGHRMSVAAMKRLWPSFVSPPVRAWVEDHLVAGTVERLVIATNAPLSTLKPSGPPVPDDGLAIEIAGNGAELRPVYGLPAIRDADINVRISGRTAVIGLGRGNIELSPGRKLAITNGSFEVADTHVNSPPAKVRFRLDGPVPAAAELLNLERLREFSGAPIEPATSPGALSAQVQVGLPLRPDLPPGSAQYAI